MIGVLLFLEQQSSNKAIKPKNIEKKDYSRKPKTRKNQFLDCVGLDVPLFCYIESLPDIDCCDDVYFVKYNSVIDLKTNNKKE